MGCGIAVRLARLAQGDLLVRSESLPLENARNTEGWIRQALDLEAATCRRPSNNQILGPRVSDIISGRQNT